MKVSYTDIKEMSLAVLKQEKSFEEASAWATKIIEQHDLEELNIQGDDGDTLLSVLAFFVGLDVRDEMGKYVHSMDDVRSKLLSLLPETTVKISYVDVKEIFLSVIAEEMSFEKASQWAVERMRLDDLGYLEVAKGEERGAIFSGLTYLAGVDLMYLPGEYLHSLDNVRDEFKEIFKEMPS